MRILILSILMAAGLAGCANPETGKQATALDVIGTPFYVVFKGTTCLATALLAAPASAVTSLSTSPYRDETLSQLSSGVDQNCGGRWVMPAS
ncbi:MAG: hypothetical protein GC201_09005 [Alphaproteobacteria bacterium]|nr:hypothetical protein [Alphaproteobacteria bacterium]